MMIQWLAPSIFGMVSFLRSRLMADLFPKQGERVIERFEAGISSKCFTTDQFNPDGPNGLIQRLLQIGRKGFCRFTVESQGEDDGLALISGAIDDGHCERKVHPPKVSIGTGRKVKIS